MTPTARCLLVTIMDVTLFMCSGATPPSHFIEDNYPVYDLILCHGSFLLNADVEYVHENKSVHGFGSYGDIMIRDRKMYVTPTPFALTTHTEGQITLILPEAILSTNVWYRVANSSAQSNCARSRLSVQFAKQRTIDKRRSEPALRPSTSLRVLPCSTRTWTRGFDGTFKCAVIRDLPPLPAR